MFMPSISNLLSFLLLYWPRPPIQCHIDMVSVDILALFLILGEKQ